jgi:hypothetical protein
MAKQKINIKGVDIAVDDRDKNKYYSLTDLAKGVEGDVSEIIRRWLRTQKTVDFLAVWEEVHNPNFNLSQMNQIKLNLSRESFYISVKKWAESTNAIGIESKAGRYGGTYAHADIALHFANWLSPEFYVYMIQEFQRLKEEEAARLGESWSIQRTITKANHYLQTASVREHLVPLMQWNTKYEGLHQASEADLLNLIVFGMTAKEWRSANPDKKGNIRDHATKLELVVLNNLQAINAMLIEDKMDKKKRADKLLRVATTEMQALQQVKPIEDLKKLGG